MVLTPAAMHAILAAPGGTAIDAFIGPAHVSTVIGSAPYQTFARDYGKPVAIAGFEPRGVEAFQGEMRLAPVEAGE